jgi:hypothetical protein
MTVNDWFWASILALGVLFLFGLWLVAWEQHKKDCPKHRKEGDG